MDDFTADLTSVYSIEEEFAGLDLAMPDDKLLTQLDDSLSRSKEHWDSFPWRLSDTDLRAVKYLYPKLPTEGNTLAGRALVEESHDDNILPENMRAILSYATGQLGVPEVTPSDTTAQAKRIARNMGLGAYQHALDDNVDQKVRVMAQAVISRKRGYLKVRLDAVTGDIVTDVINPEDVIIDRFAPFMGDPNAIHNRLRATVDELCGKFPTKADRIRQAFSIIQGRYSQMSKMVPYYETWFTYFDAKGKSKQGVATWLAEPNRIMLDKSPNPNWIYTGDDDKDKAQNLLKLPPKPFVGINYMNSGKSAIDETCLFEQAIPDQLVLNRRQAQWHKNIDLVNGRWIYDMDQIEEAQAISFVNKGSKSLLGAKVKSGKSLQDVLINVNADPLDATVYESIMDLRERIKSKMGTPNQFAGQEGQKQNTLGRDIMLKQQAGALQDDFVRAIQTMYGTYYGLLLQVMRVNYTKDQKMLVKGADGKHQEIIMGPDTLDPNVKVSVRADSTLPLDKQAIRQMSSELLKVGKIDYETAMQDLGYSDPELRAERYLRSQLDPMGYLASITQSIEQSDARDDIDAVLVGREPKDRDSYDQQYLDSYNLFLTTNEFAKLEQPQKQAIIAHLAIVQHVASQQASLQEGMLDDAGITEAPINPPLPKQTVNYRVDSKGPPPGAPQPPQQPPVTPAQPGVPPTTAPPGVSPLH